MTSQTLTEALARAVDTRGAAVGRGVLAESGQHLTAHLGTGPYIVVADENTWAAAGEQLTSSLEEAGCATVAPLIFPGTPIL